MPRQRLTFGTRLVMTSQILTPVARPLIGVAFMLGAMASLPLIDVFAKFLGQQDVPVLQIVWARLGFGAVLTLPFALVGNFVVRSIVPALSILPMTFVLAVKLPAPVVWS